uniref:DUF1134 domain-containing protein n=1 Tax=Caulobacter sp. (strain K31) TaxID=366602 RepID=B0T0M4_CAUSK
MVKIHHRQVWAAISLSGLLWLAPAAAQARPPVEPAPATATFKGEGLALVVGYHTGRGVLTFQGRRHNFVVRGVSAVGLGAERVDGTAEVRNLHAVSDFEGLYWGAGAGGVFVLGEGAAVLRNAKGVEIRLHTDNRGLQLMLAAGGARIELR